MKKHYRVLSIVVLLIVVAAARVVYSTTIHVSNDSNESIQSGIDAASPGDTVLVHCGVYYEHDIELSSGIVLRSETGESDCATIDAGGSGRGLAALWLEDAITVEGFRIENGIDYTMGGGMLIEDTDATIRNCCFANNTSALNLMPGMGALAAWGGTYRITDCVFTGNFSVHSWLGSAISISSDYAILTRCTVVNNAAASSGGIGLRGDSFELRECNIADNYGFYPGSVGGGICVGSEFEGHWIPTHVSLTDCTITGNTAVYGGGVYVWLGSTLTAFNTDIRDNVADDGPDGYCRENSTILLACCDVVEGQWFIEEGAVWELDNSDCTVATEQMTWGGVKSLYK